MAPGAAAPAASFKALTLGSFVFKGTEVPENIHSVGGTQMLAVHNFPGGQRTLQALGFFPPDEIRWTGLMVGPTASSRFFEIDVSYRVPGKPVDLTWGDWTWKGVVKEFFGTPLNEWLIRYNIVFVPQKDNSMSAMPPLTGSAGALHEALAGLGSNIPVTVNGFSLPYGLSNPLQSLYNTGVSALLNSGNVVAAMGASDIADANNYATAAFAAGAAIVNSGDTSASGLQAASSVLHVLSFAGIIQGIMSSAAPVVRTVTKVNPNLYTMASQYLGDSSRWTDIASLNGLTDPMPIGTYTLKIPNKSDLAPVPQGRFA